MTATLTLDQVLVDRTTGVVTIRWRRTGGKDLGFFRAAIPPNQTLAEKVSECNAVLRKDGYPEIGFDDIAEIGKHMAIIADVRAVKAEEFKAREAEYERRNSETEAAIAQRAAERTAASDAEFEARVRAAVAAALADKGQ